MSFYVRKTSGEQEEFDPKKFKRSLEKAGANKELIDTIFREIEAQKPKTTQDIHAIASGLLQKVNPPIAGRYNLKRALIALGPAGFSFEQFIAELMHAQGYKTQTDHIIQGTCVDHEVDVIAHKNNQNYIIECKFHQLGIKTEVQTTLYMQARFKDIQQAHHQPSFTQVMVVTNTEFTSKAIKYAACTNMQLLGWNYPTNKGLAYLIDTLGLHPITALTNLTKHQQQELIKHDIVLCRNVHAHKDLFKKLGFSGQKINQLIEQSEAICTLK